MSYPIVFYSWQSDLPRSTTRDVIRDAVQQAIDRVGCDLPLEDSPRIDEATLGEPGTAAIAETIYRKITHSSVFIADVSFVAETTVADGKVAKSVSNPNVLLETGFAAAKIGWDRIILVMNQHYGSPTRLPFDLRNRTFPAVFRLGPNSQQASKAHNELAREVENRIRVCLQADYERVDEVLSRLSTFSRQQIQKLGGSQLVFWNATNNSFSSREDLAMYQLLELGVIRAVDAATESGVGYVWTYLGRQCAKKLGVQPTAATLPDGKSVDSVVTDLSFYDQFGER